MLRHLPPAWAPRAAVGLFIAACASALAASAACAQWSVEVGVERFEWREQTTPIVVHEQGARFSGAAAFVLPRERGFLVSCRAELYGGSVEYEGSFQFDAATAASGASGYLGTIVGAAARWRWPDAADAVAGLEYETWDRQLSAKQEETYRTISLRLGVEHLASGTGGARGVVAGGGIRFLLATGLDATIEVDGVTYALGLEPGRGSNLYLHGGYRLSPHVTVVGYWDGMSLGKSNRIEFVKPDETTIVWQPESELSRLGVRFVYAW